MESQRTRLIRALSPHFSHKLFLSATPHNGYQESFTSLLELLDDQRFARTVKPDEKKLQQVMVRRLKSDIVDTNGNLVFPKRKLEMLEVAYTDEERQMHALLKAYTESRGKTVKGTRFEYGSDFVHMLLKKRLFSSPLAFANTLAKHRETLEHGKQNKSHSEIDERILRKAILKTEEEYSDDDLAEEAQNEAVETANILAPPLTPEQKEMLDKLGAWAEKTKNRADSKANVILEWLATYLKPNGQWNNKRVILFTEYRATHAWLEQILAAHGYGGDRMMYLHGSIPPDEREKIKAAFQADPAISPVRILLATDAASEGIDLQNHCAFMIHVEIPWNPNVLEQRNGRIDRHGQKEKEVHIWHPVGKGFSVTGARGTQALRDIDGDCEYLMRAVLKINTIREDLGSVGDVIARQIEDAMLGRRNSLDTTDAELKAAHAKKIIAAEKHLQERIAVLHKKLLDSQDDFHLSSEHIERAVCVALDLAEKPALTQIIDITSKGYAGKIFDVPVMPGSWGKASIGLEHPHTQKRRPITFDNNVVKDRDDVVLAHLNHKLVQMCLRLLREEIWSLNDVKKLHRVAVRSVPDSEFNSLHDATERQSNSIAVAVWSRLVITGGDYRRLHEELTLSGGELKHSGFNRITQVGKLESLVKIAKPFEPSQSLFAILKERFDRFSNSIMDTVNARSKDRLRNLSNTLNRVKEKEISDIKTILDELELSIRKELNPDTNDVAQYLPGMSPAELEQVDKDINALKARLERIPLERKEEQAVIEKHYAEPVDRTFPAAVVFLVPESQVGVI
jgi:hypothetical protein